MSLQCSLLTEPWVADAFAIVGYYKLAPRDPDARLAPDVELTDPEVLFQYPPPPPPDDDSDAEANRIAGAVKSVIKMEFCRPDGYRVCDAPAIPKFHTITQTSMPEGSRTHISVLTFFEAHKVERSVSFNSHIFVPKFLVFLSKLNMADFFKQCLDYFYLNFFIERAPTCYLNKALALLVRNVRVPLPGRCRQLDFGLGPCLTVQAQAPMSLPRTGLGVYRLFHELGIHFVVEAVRCLLNEMKVVVYGNDLATTTQCCEALIALIWPFPYNYVFAPAVGRRVLDDLLEAPTTFCIGTCHLPEDDSTFQRNGIVLIDLEKGMVNIPDSVADLCLNIDDEPRTQLLRDLTSAVSCEDFVNDWNDRQRNVHRATRIEMHLRACFLRLYATMFARCRRSMTAVRFYPHPRVLFDGAHFFGEHGFKFADNVSENSLTLKMINSFFNQFFNERYQPFRQVDIFDEICARGKDNSIDDITQQLLASDVLCSPSANDTLSNINLISAVLATSATSLFTFPRPSCDEIVDMASAPVKTAAEDDDSAPLAIGNDFNSPRHVPVDFSDNSKEQEKAGMIMAFLGSALDRLFADNSETSSGINNNDKRLLNSVVLDSPSIRRQFCLELSRRSLSNGRLNGPNFAFISELVGKILQKESQVDENGIACALLQAVSNISHRPSPTSKPIYLHHHLTLDAWWTESFWLSWLTRFVAAELSAHYSGEIPDISKEPGHSMTVLADVLSVLPAVESLKLAEERRVVEACRLCVDLMLGLLFEHSSTSAEESVSPPKKEKKKLIGLFERRNSNNKSSSNSPNSQHRHRVTALISSVISRFASGVYLPDMQLIDLLFSIKEKC